MEELRINEEKIEGNTISYHMDENRRPDSPCEFFADETHNETHRTDDNSNIPLAMKSAENDRDDNSSDPHIDMRAEFGIEEAPEDNLLNDRCDNNERDKGEDVVHLRNESISSKREGLLLVEINIEHASGCEKEKCTENTGDNITNWR